jgi:energy-coupling factor transport system permease protein
MAYSMTIGRCVAVDSPIHRLDARVKTVWFLACSILAFFIDNGVSAAWFGVVAASLLIAARIPARVLWRTVRPFLVLLVLSFAVNALVIQGGSILWSAGPLTITMRGVQLGAFVAFRTIVALAFGILLVSTTTPVALCDALESLLRPLRVCGVPYQDVAMIFSIALRYVPLLAEEASTVVDAQRSRGAAATDGSLADKARTYASLVVPLLSSSLRHAQRQTTALETRCWAAEAVRTHLSLQRLATRDAVFCLMMAAVVALFCALAIAF